MSEGVYPAGAVYMKKPIVLPVLKARRIVEEGRMKRVVDASANRSVGLLSGHTNHAEVYAVEAYEFANGRVLAEEVGGTVAPYHHYFP